MQALGLCLRLQYPVLFFFQRLELANTSYGTSIQCKNKYLLYFAILVDNNFIAEMSYLKSIIYDNILNNSVQKRFLTKQ